MSDNKVNSKTLKNLIKEVLEEKISLKYTGVNPTARKNSVGLPGAGKPFDAAMQKLVNLDNTTGTNVFDDEDLKAVGKGTPEYDTANRWFKKSTMAPSGFSDVDSYVASLGGSSGSTFFFKDSTKTDLKPELHLKNKPTQGNKNAIAKALNALINATPKPTNADVQTMIDEITAIFGTALGKGNLKTAVAAAQGILRGAPPASPISDALKIKLADIATSLEELPTQDITAPVIQDVGSAGKSGSTGGSFPPGLIGPLNDMFSGEDTYGKRLQKLSDVSNLLVNGSATKIKQAYKGKEREFLRDIIVMDYFATIFREVDDRAIAYYFEALGALIGGGKVAGAAGVSGDFTVAVANGQVNFEGSSKFYKSGSASGQSLSGFMPGVEVLYLNAKKSSTDPQKRTVLPIMAFTIRLDSEPTYSTADQSDTLPISTVPAGLFDGKFRPKGKQTGKVTAVPHVAKQDNDAHGVSGAIQEDDIYYHLKFGANIAGQEFKLYFASNSGVDTLKKLLDSVTSKNNFDSKLKKAYDFMKEYFKNIKLSQSSIKDYIGTNDVQKGTDALTAMDEADANLQGMIGSVGGTISNKRPAGAQNRVVTENKITSSFLKKLFKETLKK